MALLTLDEAAARIGASRETIDEWVRIGLMTVQEGPDKINLPIALPGNSQPEKYVEEEELFEQAESAGWFELGTENWDSIEDE
jgi:hypothetical protein